MNMLALIGIAYWHENHRSEGRIENSIQILSRVIYTCFKKIDARHRVKNLFTVWDTEIQGLVIQIHPTNLWSTISIDDWQDRGDRTKQDHIAHHRMHEDCVEDIFIIWKSTSLHTRYVYLCVYAERHENSVCSTTRWKKVFTRKYTRVIE